MAVAVDWLDTYRAGRLNEMLGMFSADAEIDCACESSGAVHGEEGMAAYWQRRFIERPALDLLDLQSAVTPWWSPTEPPAGSWRHCSMLQMMA
jgi:hypothetical protein